MSEESLRPVTVDEHRTQANLNLKKGQNAVNEALNFPTGDAFEQDLTTILNSDWEEKGESISIALVDCDDFLHINEDFGRNEGDRILIMLANAIKECIRKADVVIRWGGEEFVVFLLGADLEAGVRIGEEIRQKVEQMDYGVCPVTISVGVSQYDLGDYRATIRRADKALYYAKATGRNRVVTDKEVPEDASV